MLQRLTPLATVQGGVFSAAQAAAEGLGHKDRRTLVRAGILREIRRGIFTLQVTWDSADDRGRHRLALAAALLIRGWVAAGGGAHAYVGGRRTAGFLHGLPVQPSPKQLAALAAGTQRGVRTSAETALLHAEARRIRRGQGPLHVDLVSADRCRRTYRAGVDVRPATLHAGHVVLDHGVPITSLARTAVDLMRTGTMADAVIAADGALHIGLERADLLAAARFCANWSNGSQALAAAESANGLAESAAESLARLVCREQGLPEPELQVELFDDHGLIGRVDLLFRSFRLVLEVDGLVKLIDPWCGDPIEAMRRQEAREDRLRRSGWVVIRTTWYELMHAPEALVRRLKAALATPVG